MGMLKEFREFAMKGNMIDMAVGIMIGAAFGSVVTSLVNDVLTPVISQFSGGVNFSDFAVDLRSVVPGEQPGEPLWLKWGSFVQTLIDFFIRAFALFLIVKMINTAKKRFEREQAAAPPPAPPEEVRLLTEIRDALKAAPR